MIRGFYISNKEQKAKKKGCVTSSKFEAQAGILFASNLLEQ